MKSKKMEETRDLIFTASAQIVLREGVDRLNTNYIAERAGISIGTLYNHFEDKNEITAGLLERVIETRISRIKDAMGLSMLIADTDEIVSRIVESLFYPGTEEDALLEAALLPFVPSQDAYREARFRKIEAYLSPLIKALMLIKLPSDKRDIDTMCFVLITSVTTLIVTAHLPEGRHLKKDALKVELKRLILRYVEP